MQMEALMTNSLVVSAHSNGFINVWSYLETESASSGSASAGASVTKPVGKSASTPCLPAARGSEEGKGDKSSKNNDYFLKLKEVRYRYIVVYKL